jgi:hypothetical protein
MAGLEPYREGREPGCMRGRTGGGRSTATHAALDVLHDRAELLTRLAIEGAAFTQARAYSLQ